ncbi:MAG: 50S ribosomal protein L11 methyltransferase [Peptostreptococcales bacterium]
MNWIECEISISHEGIETVIALLMNEGYESFVIEDPKEFNAMASSASNWDYVDEDLIVDENQESRLKFYIEETQEGKEKILDLSNIIQRFKQKNKDLNLGSLQFHIRNVKDEDWLHNWKKYFKPIPITEKIIIKPGWEKYEKKCSDEIVIEIDPGMAFGTGTHETTSMCIEFLEKYIEKDLDTVMDVGCGSGILSIVAEKLGAPKVLGIDIDPVAVEVAKENVRDNASHERVYIFQGDLTKENDFKADIIVANIIAEAIIYLCKDIKKNLTHKRLLIVSGIIIEKKDDVVKALVENNFSILETKIKGEWVAMVCELIE